MTRFLFFIALFSLPASAQELPWTLDCKEVIHAEAKDNLTDYDVGKSKRFELTFSRRAADDWVMIGNLGTVPIVALAGPGVVHLFETTPVGAINVTQISTTGDQDEYPAVHSRHTVIWGEQVPSQYLLRCRGR
jgi:hypothetical protein